MRVRKWLIHAIAYCSGCNFEEQDYHIAQKKGRQHALKTGHMVTIETAYAQIYNNKNL